MEWPEPAANMAVHGTTQRTVPVPWPSVTKNRPLVPAVLFGGQHYRRRVVREGAAGERCDRVGEPGLKCGSAARAVFDRERNQSLLAELGIVAVARLGNAVREEHEAVA